MKRLLSATIYFAITFILSTCYDSTNKESYAKYFPADSIQSEKGDSMINKLLKSDDLWKKELTEEQYKILRKKGTEPAFTGKYWDTKEEGVYYCAGCGLKLFESDTKFDSGCGWPSFYQPSSNTVIDPSADKSFGMIRTEVLCSKCGGHLGHVFDDGPNPTGLRYCINSGALKFEKKKTE